MANYRIITLDLGTVVNGQELVPAGIRYDEVAVQAFSTGATALLAFGQQAGRLVPVIFVGQVWSFTPGENQGLFFTNSIAQPGKTLKLFLGFTATTVEGADQATFAGGVFPATYKLTSFRAVYRRLTRPYALSIATTANTLSHVASLYHTAAAILLAKVRHVWFAIESASVAGIYMAQLHIFSVGVPGSGTVITPLSTRSSVTGAEATAIALPTLTPNTFGGLLAEHEYNLGITGAVPTVNPPSGLIWTDLLNPTGGAEPDHDRELPQLRPGVAEGWLVSLDPSATATVNAYCTIEFTEEPVP